MLVFQFLIFALPLKNNIPHFINKTSDIETLNFQSEFKKCLKRCNIAIFKVFCTSKDDLCVKTTLWQSTWLRFSYGWFALQNFNH
jgi:hypothetical protein